MSRKPIYKAKNMKMSTVQALLKSQKTTQPQNEVSVTPEPTQTHKIEVSTPNKIKEGKHEFGFICY